MRRIATIVAVSVLGAATTAVLPVSATAVDWTRITAPAGPDHSFFGFFDNKTVSDQPLTISGIAASTVTQVSIYCFMRRDTKTTSNAPLATVSVTNGAFSASGVPAPQDRHPCVLRAIPQSYSGVDGAGNNNGYVAEFAGPTFFGGELLRSVDSGTGLTLDWTTSTEHPYAHDYFGPPDGLGVGSMDVVMTDTDEVYDGLFDGDIELLRTNIAGTHASIRIDGKDAYPPQSLAAVTSLYNTSITVSAHRLAGGELSVVQREPLRFCAGTSPCTPTPTGVALIRTIRTSHHGALAIVRDKFVDVDHVSHTLSAEYYSYISGHDPEDGVKMPGSSSFKIPTGGSTVATPVGPHTIYMTSDVYAADSDLQRTDGGITYSAHANVFFKDSYEFAMRYARTVPKNGFAAFSWGAETAETAAGVSALAGPAQRALTPHVAIGAPPKSTSDNTPTVRGRVTNATNGLPTKVRITIGTTSKLVPVALDGSYHATFSLPIGKHTVKVHATDPSGLVLSAQRTFTVT